MNNKDQSKNQLHKRFSDTEVQSLFQDYCYGNRSRADIEEILDIKKTQFFFHLNQYRKDPPHFSLAYDRFTPRKLSTQDEWLIMREIEEDRKLIVDRSLPVYHYNYSAIQDRLEQKDVIVSLPTIIKIAKKMGCYQERKKLKNKHDREVITTAVGALIQHDGSTHRWSPFAKEKWTLITSLDDCSRKILYADLFRSETTWAHIQAAESVVKQFGIPLRYYVDSLRIFRFVQNRDSIWQKQVLQTDEVDPHWKQVMKSLHIEVVHALSPQAKGKIERPYGWLQDRIVRTCLKDHLVNIDDVRKYALEPEVRRYNHSQVHSTTKEIPDYRFDRLIRQKNNFFRPFQIPSPYQSSKDIFCIHENRITDGYHKISFMNHSIFLPTVPIHRDVEIHMIPDPVKQSIELRFWWNQGFVNSILYPIQEFPTVHF